MAKDSADLPRVATAHEVTRQAMTPEMDDHARAAWTAKAADCVRRNGVVVLEEAIPADAIFAVFDDFKVRHDVHMAPGQKKLYRRFQTDPLRAQTPTAIDGPVANPAFFAAPSVLAVVKSMLGEDVIIGEMGLVITHAGAAAQETHRDSNFLFGGVEGELELPPFAITVLIPLRDVSLDMGPTEFWPGTHRIADEAIATAVPSQRAALRAGSAVMIDSRTFHRGGAHIAGPVRPTCYFSFHRPWYVENFGYEAKPQVRVTPAMLRRLPEAYRPLFAWALHLNRTDGVHEFAYRWIGRLRRTLMGLIGR